MDYLNQSMDMALLQSKKMPSLDRAMDPTKSKNYAQIEKAAEEFEAVFLTQMVEQMFAMTPVDNQFGGGQGEKVFKSMMAQEYGKVMASNGGIGLADEVKKEMLRMQEGR